MDKIPAAASSAPPASAPAEVYTPTSIKVRRELADAVSHSIEGSAVYTPQRLTSDLLQASPQSFCKGLRLCHEKSLRSKLLAHGITDCDIQEEMPIAQESVELGAEPYKQLPLASERIRKIGAKIAQRCGDSTLSFRKTCEDIEALSALNIIVINEEIAQRSARTDDELEWLLEHEVAHYLNQDLFHETAWLQATDGRVAEEEQDAILDRQSRCDEQFADLGPASKSLRLALAYKTVTSNWVNNLGIGSPSTHPAYWDRAKVAMALEAFHIQHSKENERRMNRLGQPRAKRSLEKEFDAVS